MKKLLLALLLCSGGYLHAQNVPAFSIEDKKMDAYISKRKPAVLTVELTNLPIGHQPVKVQYTLVNLGPGGFQTPRYSTIGASGTASITLDQNLPNQQIWLNVDNYMYAGIYVNEGLKVTIDASIVGPNKKVYMIGDGMTYSGPDGELNTVMNKAVMFKKNEHDALFGKLYERCMKRKEFSDAAFAATTDSIGKLLMNIADEFGAEYPRYAAAVKNELLSEYYNNLFLAYWGGKMPAGLYAAAIKHQPDFTSNGSSGYYRYLTSMERSNIRFKKGEPWFKRMMQVYDSLYTVQKADVMKLYLLEETKEEFAAAYPTIISDIKTNWCKQLAVKELEKCKATQRKVDSLFAASSKIVNADLGAPLVKLPFGAELYQLDASADADKFVSNLKAKFKNKAIIVDIWATWCAPCIADLPFSKDLHDKTKDLSIEYVYLCTNSASTIDTWKNKVAAMQIPGTHVFVDDSVLAKVRAAFGTGGGFPTYVTIDINGQVKPKAVGHMQFETPASIKKAVGL